MKKNNKRQDNTLMYKAFLELKTEEEVKAFLEDLCSMTELMAMEQRFEVAKLLYKGLIYNAIMENTGASSAIISRVNRSLQYGAGGYGTVFSRLEVGEGE
ncbi:MAG: YerC/YecD family TrpR-related protein [Clostridiales bacterium]|nr:YerC/YecD family TrpR-related protein [Clostridiales bacterium]